MTKRSDLPTDSKAAVILLALLFSSACAEKAPSGLSIHIATSGLQLGTDFDRIEGKVWQQSPTGWPSSPAFDVTSKVGSDVDEVMLPTTLAIQGGTSPDQEARITVTALEGAVPVVSLTAELQVPTDRVADLWMVLAADCVGVVCQSEFSCRHDMACVSNTAPLPSDPTVATNPDAGGLAKDGADATLDGAPEGTPNEGQADSVDDEAGDLRVDAPPACEASTSNDPKNCGGCGVACAAGFGCQEGVCSCAAADDVCGGVCVDERSDPQNCGGCGQLCIDGQSCQSGACGNPPSCAPDGFGLTNCGPGASESCCTSSEVAGGTFYRQYVANGAATTDKFPATVSDVRIDKYLVTVGRFRQFVDAVLPADGPGWLPAPGSGKHAHLNGGLGLEDSSAPGFYEPGWVATDDVQLSPTDAQLACDPDYATWTATASSEDNLPINCVNWFEAYAFCIWDGGFLPSEAEWGYVAAGGSQQSEYPWGSTDPGAGNQYAIYGCLYPDGSAGTCAGRANIAPVGTAAAGAGLWGQLDLLGDVWEWTLAFNGPYDQVASQCVDCEILTATDGERVTRGGAFNEVLASSTQRNPVDPHTPGRGRGFRCARTP
jgi:formylglycine-generating enzyme required for sulfatase activity